MSWFCKHEWDYLKAKTKTQLRSDRICGKQCIAPITKCGVSVYCRKCGKIHRRLSKKLGRLYATHIAHEIENDILEGIAEESEHVLEILKVHKQKLGDK